MVDHILRLDIKPVRTYNDGRQRKTTLTSFEKVLKIKRVGFRTAQEHLHRKQRRRRMSGHRRQRRPVKAVPIPIRWFFLIR